MRERVARWLADYLEGLEDRPAFEQSFDGSRKELLEAKRVLKGFIAPIQDNLNEVK